MINFCRLFTCFGSINDVYDCFVQHKYISDDLISKYQVAQTGYHASILHVPNIHLKDNTIREAAVIVCDSTQQGFNNIFDYINMLKKIRNHSNIIQFIEPKYYDWYYETPIGCNVDNYQYVVTLEYFPCTLLEFVQNIRQLTNSEINNIRDALISAITYMHECGYSHNDISPDNIGLRNNSVQHNLVIDDVILFDLELATPIYEMGYPCYCGKRLFQAISAHETGDSRIYEHSDFESIEYVILWCRNGGELPWNLEMCDTTIIQCKTQYLESLNNNNN